MIGEVRRGVGTLLVLWALAACGASPSPAAAPGAPTGTLVVVVVTGPERVPFRPKLARIQRANEQLAKRLGRSIQIEIDGALMPESEDGAEDLLARLVETTAQDIDEIAQREPRALEFARERFARLVVRYSPAEATARQTWQRRPSYAKLEPGSKTVDVVRGRADGSALERGVVGSELLRAYKAVETERYADVLPDALTRAERRAWFAYHDHGGTRSRAGDGPDRITQVDGFRVRGMLMLHAMATRDGEADLARDARKWLIAAVRDFAGAYHHDAASIERAAPGSHFKLAEAAYMEWLRAELPRMSLDERGVIGRALWVIDFRTPSALPDRFATYAFPGIDRMAFAFAAIDSWIAAGHPPARGSREVPALYADIVSPVEIDTEDGGLRFHEIGRSDHLFRRWVFVDAAREETYAAGVLARNDPQLATAALLGALRERRGQTEYLRLLRRFEGNLGLWKIGVSVLREVVYRPDDALIEEARRLWRTNPAARGAVLFWFARKVEVSYDAERDWRDLLQGIVGDEAVLDSYLEAGFEALQLLPVAWPALAKSGARARVILKHARPLLDMKLRVHPGTRGVAGTLAEIARRFCEERATTEIAELRAFARAEVEARPGAGLGAVVDATEPAACAAKPPPRARPPQKDRRPPQGGRPDLFPPKAPLPPEER